MHIRHAQFLLSAIALTLSLAACTSTAPAKPESRIDPSANIPAAKTFGWQPANSNLVSTNVTQRKFDENIHQAINTDLNRKGYVEAADPDLLLAYEISAYEKTKSSPLSVGIGMGSWGGNVGGSVGVGTGGRSRTVQQSRLTVRVVDRKTDKEVYLGTMTGSIAPGSSSNDISGVVSQALKDFPPRRP
jgi:Domain of unknown function (DUF4136)